MMMIMMMRGLKMIGVMRMTMTMLSTQRKIRLWMNLETKTSAM